MSSMGGAVIAACRQKGQALALRFGAGPSCWFFGVTETDGVGLMGNGRGKVVVAMSGGVDSSVAACLLREDGYEVIGLFMRTGIEHSENDESAATSCDRHRGCCSAADAADARAVAGMLDVPFYALNFKAQFEQIISYFTDEYLHGRTPNPCVMCNEYLKFGRLAEYGRAVGADFVATGHHARITNVDGECQLHRGRDLTKDQSYVLFGLGRDQLPQLLLPIGALTKDEVRREARRFGLRLSDKRESQDICFVPDRDYARVVRARKPEAFAPGPILDTAGQQVGQHEGIANFTIGQRRGLGVAMGEPVYVTRIDAETNTVVIGPREALAKDTLEASRMNWLIEPPTKPFDASVKIRYAHKPARARVIPGDAGTVHVRFDEPQQAVTPGQAAVVYEGERVLGGGWIDA